MHKNEDTAMSLQQVLLTPKYVSIHVVQMDSDHRKQSLELLKQKFRKIWTQPTDQDGCSILILKKQLVLTRLELFMVDYNAQ